MNVVRCAIFAVAMSSVLLGAQETAMPNLTAPAELTQQQRIASGWEGDMNFYIGLSLKAMGLNVNKGGGAALGAMMSNLKPGLLLGFNTKSYYFNQSAWGWYFTSNVGQVAIDTQDVGTAVSGTQVEDLGTEVKGMYAYFSPVFFYNWGDKTVRSNDEQGFKVGVGVGASYLSLKGDVIFTELVTQDQHDVDVTGIGISLIVLLEYRRGPWMFRMGNNGPTLSRDGYNYLFSDISIDAGYAFAF